mmetsp:Transcript_33666/g.83884  ORF Transcript_33666/g.83884 Transcript_33666/m.83884 type:complete len:232 (-) Transcript_33666:895-1590(-)
MSVLPSSSSCLLREAAPKSTALADTRTPLFRATSALTRCKSASTSFEFSSWRPTVLLSLLVACAAPRTISTTRMSSLFAPLFGFSRKPIAPAFNVWGDSEISSARTREAATTHGLGPAQGPRSASHSYIRLSAVWLARCEYGTANRSKQPPPVASRPSPPGKSRLSPQKCIGGAAVSTLAHTASSPREAGLVSAHPSKKTALASDGRIPSRKSDSIRANTLSIVCQKFRPV